MSSRPKSTANNNVASFDIERFKKQMEAFAEGRDREPLFDIDFEDIQRLSESANGDKSDTLIVGPTAEAQLRRLFSYFGFHQLPATYGELMGNFLYCRALYSQPAPAGCSEEDRRIWDKAILSACSKCDPERLEAQTAVVNGKYELLPEIHVRRETWAKNTAAYTEFEDGE
ncbi:hypothetical protein JJQ59_04725 [Cupriavidus necator]|uniref:Uncharacterized protein n=1 Tax=Cupriavidus necator TaxID=106590 RepID=A0A367PQV2_CUPNE|nr:hypothetical protein [Cupriavidus necator]QQX85252.1 hypothetical protein JJQ59_04725 [Cupriavidus necator]RCJ10282.1 hypothetical protein DDK22_01075 [Cupriavidus necator]